MASKKSKRKTAVHGSANGDTPKKRVLRASALGFFITLLIGLVLLLSGTAVALYSGDPSAFTEPVGYTALYTVALLGGAICPVLDRSSPYLVCALSSGGAAVVHCLAALALPHSLASGMELTTQIAMRAAYVAAAFLGCTVAIKLGRSSARKKKRRYSR